MSVKRITIRLSGDEYAALEAEATRERRTVAQQAAYRVTRGNVSLVAPYPVVVPWTEPIPPWRQWTCQTSTSAGLNLNSADD